MSDVHEILVQEYLQEAVNQVWYLWKSAHW
jgi:hypothetical protein